MPRNITITFADGSTHVYANAPDSVTPDQVEARATKDFGKPVKDISGQSVGAAPAAPAQAPPSFFGDIGDVMAGSVNKFVADQNAEMARNKANVKRPAMEQLMSAPHDIVANGLGDAFKMGGDLVGIAASPIAGVTHAVLRPAADVLGGAAYDAGFPAYGPARPFTPLHPGPAPTRAESQANTESALTGSVGLLGPEIGAAGKIRAAQALGGAPATGAEAIAALRSRPMPAPAAAAWSPANTIPPEAEALLTPASAGRKAATAGNGPRGKATALDSRADDTVAPAQTSGGAGGAEVGPAAPAQAPAAVSPGTKAAAVVGPEIERKAVAKVVSLARAAGVTPDIAGADTGLTTAENIGGGADGTMMALSRRTGATKNALLGTFADRTASLPQRFEDAVTGSTGIDRAFIEGDVEQVAKRAQAAAKPLYDSYEALPARTSPELDSLLGTPHVRKALEAALTNAKNERAPAHEIQNIQQLVDGLPTDSGPAGNPADYLEHAREFQAAQAVAAAKRLKVSRGPSLADWLAKKGGVKDTGGDVAALDGHILHRGKPFQRKLVTGDGMGLDDASQAAWEAGYFPHHAEAPEVPEFLDAIRRDIAGDKFYAAPQSEQEALAGRVGDFETLLNHHEINPAGKSASQLAKEVGDAQAQASSYEDLLKNGTASAEPQTETVARQVPTPRALNDIKKVLDKDYIQRKMAAEIKGQAPGDWSKNKVYAEFRQEVETLFKKDFNYKGMQAAGGDAPKLQEAFREGKALIDKNDVQSLKAKTLEMSPLEKKIALGGWVRATVDQAQSRQGIPYNQLVRYARDDFAARVAHMSGSPAVGAKFQAEMKTILRERAGMRLNPNANSVSGDIIQGNKDIDASGFGDVDGTGVLKAVTEPKKAVLKLAADRFGSALEKRFTPGREAERNRLGELLTDPAAFREAYGRVSALGAATKAARSAALGGATEVAARAAQTGAAGAALGNGGSSRQPPALGR